jgi:UDP-N-acetyl-D-mannosaminuronic acid dehydrogenase
MRQGAENMKKLVVIGMGYVGIPAAALFADVSGLEVVGIQRRSPRSGWKIDMLNNGKSPFPRNEPGIAELLERVVAKRTFRVSEDFEEIRTADYILVDVQTPIESNHIPQYDSLKEVSSKVGTFLRKGALVCIESTVAPGTTANVVRPILEKASLLKAGKDFHLAFSYERVMVGRLLHNIQNYPRIVGGLTSECGRLAQQLYRSIVKEDVVVTNCITAEVAKTAENAYRDVNIAFANEVALACESLGVDVYEVRKLVNNLPNDPSHPASNPVRNLHVPGAGVGGHCLPKDSWLLKYGVDTYGKTPVALTVTLDSRHVNDAMPIHMADLAERGLRARAVSLDNARVTILGYAFLENSDDTRNTPARILVEELRRRGTRNVTIHDPFVREEELSGVMRDVYAALHDADCACLMTRHSAYADLDPTKVASVMRNAIVVDGRNQLGHWEGRGDVEVLSVGKPSAVRQQGDSPRK